MDSCKEIDTQSGFTIYSALAWNISGDFQSVSGAIWTLVGQRYHQWLANTDRLLQFISWGGLYNQQKGGMAIDPSVIKLLCFEWQRPLKQLCRLQRRHKLSAAQASAAPTCAMYHNILLVFGLIILWHHDVCHWSVLTWLWCIEQSYILFWILLESGTAYCLNWRYLHWLDIESVYFVFDAEKLILPIEKLLHFEFGLWDALALWGQWPYLFVLFVQELCDEMFRYCEDNTYIIVIVT